MNNKTFLIIAAAALAGCGARTTTAVRAGPAPQTETYTYALEAVDRTLGLRRDTSVTHVLADISAANLRRTDSTLVAFGTRNTFSDTLSNTRGIGAARRWIHGQLEQDGKACGGCLEVEYYGEVVPVQRAGGRAVNVVDVLAWLPGRDTTHVVVIGGHYDSCICSIRGGGNDSTADAPGANDDGSGTSAVMELARVFGKHYPKGLNSSILFVAYAAEEQGLLGSEILAKHLHDAGYHVIAGMADDMDGNVSGGGRTDSTSMRIFAADPDNSPSRELGRYVWALDAVYLPSFEVLPVWRLDRIQRGGDHEPYINLGDAGLRFSERVENYNRQHLPTDDFAHVNFGYLANVARVNAMTVASLAAAPVTPANARATRQGRAGATATSNAEPTNSGGQDWTLSWEASPGATSYEVLVRSTTSPTWEQVIPVGGATSCTLERQLDDEWAGVRAVGAHGARSMAASMPAPNPPRLINRPPATGAPAAPAPPRTPRSAPSAPPPTCGA